MKPWYTFCERYCISGNFGGNLILAILARSTQPPKLNHAKFSIPPIKVIIKVLSTGIGIYVGETILANKCTRKLQVQDIFKFVSTNLQI